MKFTVLIPTYNNGVVIRSAIESVLEQTLGDFELFVVSDGAPPETHAVVEGFAARDPRVRLFKFPKGERHGEAWRHRALEEAKSDAVCYVSDDDFWFPDHLEMMRDLLAEADFAHTRHAAITPAFTLSHIVGGIGNPEVRRRMVEERVNFFNLSVAGHRFDAYHRLPVGWSPAPPDIWTDLYMWRKWLTAEGMRYASTAIITSLHFARGARLGARGDAAEAQEILYWREAFGDPRMRNATRLLTAQSADCVLLADIARMARESPPDEAAGPSLWRRVAQMEDELRRVRSSRLWRHTQPLRLLWRRMRNVATRD